MARRGPVARLYDAVIGTAKRIGGALAQLRAGSGQAGMARMQGPYGGGGYGGSAGTNLSKIDQILHFRGWTYRCYDYICTRCAKELPVAALAVDPGDKTDHDLQAKAFLAGRSASPPTARSWARKAWVAKAQGPARPNEEYEFLPASHDLSRLLADPNDPETGVSLWYEAELFNLLTGEDYLWKVVDGSGRVVELWVIPSHWVRPVCLGQERLVDYFEVGPRGTSAGLVRFAPEEVIWNKRPNPLSKLYPASPLQAMAQVVDTYEQTEAARNYGLQNGDAIGTTITVPADVQLNDDQARRLEARFVAKYSGVFNFNRPMVLEGGAVLTPAPPERELAFMGSMDQLRRYVMAHAGLDEVVLGFGAVTTRASAVAALINVNRNTIDPRKRVRASLLTEKLARGFDERARVFYPPDKDEIDPDAMRQDFIAGGPLNAVAPNDYRTHVLGLEPFPEEIYDRPLIAPGLVNPGTDVGEWDGDGGGLPGLEGTDAGSQADGAANDSRLDAREKLLDLLAVGHVNGIAAKKKGWNESDHPRGQPDNAGQFGSGGGGESKDKPKPKPGGSENPVVAGGPGDWQTPDWVHAPGPRSQDRWLNRHTGRIAYGTDSPVGRSEAKRKADAEKRDAGLSRPAFLERQAAENAAPFEKATGVTAEELIGVVGGMPGSGVQVTPATSGIGVHLSIGNHPDVTHWSRTLDVGEDGSLNLSNNAFFLRPSAQGSGFGTQVFASQIKGCIEAGVSTVRTTAGRGDYGGERMNGYYTWPRLGYDAPLSVDQLAKLPPALAGAKTVLDLYETPEGRAWWKASGTTTQMTFDVSPDSRSMAALNTYLVSKKQPTIEYTAGQHAKNLGRQAERQRVKAEAAAEAVHAEFAPRVIQAGLDAAEVRAVAASLRTGSLRATPSDRLRSAYATAMNQVATRRLVERFDSEDGRAISGRYAGYAKEAGVAPADMETRVRLRAKLESQYLLDPDPRRMIRTVYMRVLDDMRSTNAAARIR